VLSVFYLLFYPLDPDYFYIAKITFFLGLVGVLATVVIALFMEQILVLIGRIQRRQSGTNSEE
jgi:hypothetical protein